MQHASPDVGAGALVATALLMSTWVACASLGADAALDFCCSSTCSPSSCSCCCCCRCGGDFGLVLQLLRSGSKSRGSAQVSSRAGGGGERVTTAVAVVLVQLTVLGAHTLSEQLLLRMLLEAVALGVELAPAVPVPTGYCSMAQVGAEAGAGVALEAGLEFWFGFGFGVGVGVGVGV